MSGQATPDPINSDESAIEQAALTSIAVAAQLQALVDLNRGPVTIGRNTYKAIFFVHVDLDTFRGETIPLAVQRAYSRLICE